VVRGWERCRGSGDPLYKQGNKGIMTVTLLVVDWATKYSAAVMYRYKDRYRHRHYVTVCCWWLIGPPTKYSAAVMYSASSMRHVPSWVVRR
jgi:hypothetical protein